MAYISAAELKTYLGKTLTDDDALIAAVIPAAQKAIENYTGRVFEASADTTRYLNAVDMVVGQTLYLDKDLCYVKAITNNADGASPDVLVAATDFITVPRNETPYWAIKLKANSGKYWHYTYDPEEGIKIEGKWAYSTTPPDDIKMACKRMAGYYLKLKDAQVFDVTAQPEMGIITLPKGMPADVKIMLASYVKL